MAVYVDDFDAPYGNMIMCHMIADTDEELHAMAQKIGVARRWHQARPAHKYSHYDICKSKKTKALQHGAIPITSKELVRIARNTQYAATHSPQMLR